MVLQTHKHTHTRTQSFIVKDVLCDRQIFNTDRERPFHLHILASCLLREREVTRVRSAQGAEPDTN